MNTTRSLKKGFTLIELLVVIAIIGILASVILAALSSARSKARDVTRVSDVKQIQTGIELYFTNSGHYPVSGGQIADCWRHGQATWIPDSGNYNWSAEILPQQPQDPIDNCCWPEGNCGAAGDAGTYEYWSDGTRYLIAARLENTTNPTINATKVIDPRTGAPFSNNGPLAKYAFVGTN